jgi:serine/threonine protein kinase
MADGKEVAVKMMMRQDSEATEALAQEFNILRSLDHDGIVRPVDCGEDSTWMALELLDQGEKLTAVVLRDELSFEGACKVLLDLAAAISYLHSLSTPIVHRDVKPDNVLCHGAGALKYCPEIRLLDFNVAMRMFDKECFSPVGTYPYAAPEVLDCRAYGMEADVWGAAATACFAFSKISPPYTAVAFDAYFSEAAWARIPPSIVACLAECLQQDALARPLASELEARSRVACSM